jgi:purine-nucleoside phosphorylase
MTYFDQVSEAARFLLGKLGSLRPHVGIVLGSGLGAVADAVIDPIAGPYAQIPHFPHPTVEGHSGRIVAGLLGGVFGDRSSSLASADGVPVVVMQGRVHFYEGYSPLEVTFPMRVLGALGIRAVVLTNAAGGIDEGYRQGQLVALADHINLMGWNPLVGPNEPRFALRPEAELHSPAPASQPPASRLDLPASGLDLLASGPQFPAPGLRFPDMTEAYSKRLRALAKQAAGEEGFALDEGVYLAVSGPSFETPAEIRAFRALGATLVGMSTVPETIVARHMGVEVLGLSCVTNLAAGLSTTPLSHEEVQETGRRVEQRLAGLLQRLTPKIAALAGMAAGKAGEKQP